MRILLPILVVISFLSGCVKRTITISSTPNGALVWVNDREVGRTPVQFGFIYYGEYDVRLEKDGYEPIMTTRWAEFPWWDAPMIDMVTEVVTRNLESRVSWNFALEPRNDDPVLLLQRATEFRKDSIRGGLE